MVKRKSDDKPATKAKAKAKVKGETGASKEVQGMEYVQMFNSWLSL